MSNNITKEKLNKMYLDEAFELKIFKTKGMNNPGINYKGTAGGLLCAYARLIESILESDLIPTALLEDAYNFIKSETRGKHGSK